jgi:uncharacterized repeat protein (TIGR03803 family)
MVAGAATVMMLAAGSGAAPAEAGQYRQLYTFRGHRDGAYIYGGVIKVGGLLYGTAAGGGVPGSACGGLGCGVVFSVDPNTGAETVVHNFENRRTDGQKPAAGLLNVGGTLYGTTVAGGTSKNGNGTVFSVNAGSGAEQLVYSFTGTREINTEAAVPVASVIKVGGDLFGTTYYGGLAGEGTVFRVNPKTGTERLLHSFTAGTDGALPYANLINVGGTLYGTTFVGGTGSCTYLNFSGCGTVFSVNPKTGAETVVYRFAGGNDGSNPTGGLLKIGDELWGTSQGGGGSANCAPVGCGTVFAINLKTRVERPVYVFQAGSDGLAPASNLIEVGGTLYGTTSAGGGAQACVAGCGTIFSVNRKTGAERVLYNFPKARDGNSPVAGLIYADGTLYGTTVYGGGAGCFGGGCGAVFAFRP